LVAAGPDAGGAVVWEVRHRPYRPKARVKVQVVPALAALPFQIGLERLGSGGNCVLFPIDRGRKIRPGSEAPFDTVLRLDVQPRALEEIRQECEYFQQAASGGYGPALGGQDPFYAVQDEWRSDRYRLGLVCRRYTGDLYQLFKLLAHRRDHPSTLVRDLQRRLAELFDRMLENGLVHLDMKLANILVDWETRTGPSGSVEYVEVLGMTLADFGQEWCSPTEDRVDTRYYQWMMWFPVYGQCLRPGYPPLFQECNRDFWEQEQHRPGLGAFLKKLPPLLPVGHYSHRVLVEIHDRLTPSGQTRLWQRIAAAAARCRCLPASELAFRVAPPGAQQLFSVFILLGLEAIAELPVPATKRKRDESGSPPGRGAGPAGVPGRGKPQGGREREHPRPHSPHHTA
jgi:hypothetical protein